MVCTHVKVCWCTQMLLGSEDSSVWVKFSPAEGGSDDMKAKVQLRFKAREALSALYLRSKQRLAANTQPDKHVISLLQVRACVTVGMCASDVARDDESFSCRVAQERIRNAIQRRISWCA